MRFDHLVIHTDDNKQQLKTLQARLNPMGYPFDPGRGRRTLNYRVHNINVGCEYIEVVRLSNPNRPGWMPLWSHYYQSGARGAYCMFIEVEDVERTAVAIKKAGISARGPAILPYHHLMGLLRLESPYFIYYMPSFPDTVFHLALMQYKQPGLRERFQGGLAPNAIEKGIQGIRRVEVDLPKLEESLPMLKTILGNELREGKNEYSIQMEKTRLIFRASPDQETRVRLLTVASQRERLGGSFQIDNVEVVTGGG